MRANYLQAKCRLEPRYKCHYSATNLNTDQLTQNVVHDLSPVSQVLRLPMSVVVLDLLIHPAQHRADLCRVMPAVSHDRVDGMAEAMGRQPPVTRLDFSPPQRPFEAAAPLGLADP